MCKDMARYNNWNKERTFKVTGIQEKSNSFHSGNSSKIGDSDDC